MLSRRRRTDDGRVMGRLLAIALILGGLVGFLEIYSKGVGGAFGGALARLTKPAEDWTAEKAPVPRGAQREPWEREARTPPPGIAQRVRERANRAMATGAQRRGAD
jgi:hypothetical protein